MNQQKQHPNEIATGLQNGDPEAWRLLFKKHAPQVWRYVAIRMQGKAAGSVADVVQETMMAAAKSARTYDADRGTIWNWLRGIAHNQVALAYRTGARQNVLKRAANELAQTGGRLARWLNDSSELPEDILAKGETADLVRNVLGQLPAEYGELLTSKYLDDESIQQIASRKGSTVASVNSKLARARQAFREQFDTNE